MASFGIIGAGGEGTHFIELYREERKFSERFD
ncbi:MAG: hypothetical protein ACI8YQ_000415 [Polaribacter sp.]|jgi:hypothetical protein